MIYLSGAKNPHIRPDMERGEIGLMNGPASAYDVSGVAVWAMDNGCFTDTYPGDDAYLATLTKYAAHADRCLFATAPDVVGDGAATLARSGPMFARIRALGYPVALVAQDGHEAMALPWDDFDVLFIGGSTEWKLGLAAATLIREAKLRGKGVHVGRVNSRTRYDRFAELGADSCDGTYLAFGPAINAPKLRTWLRRPSAQIPLLRLAWYETLLLLEGADDSERAAADTGGVEGGYLLALAIIVAVALVYLAVAVQAGAAR